MIDRTAAFCSHKAPEVFQSVAFQQQIWTVDPFDVPEIHGSAREVFDRLLNRATTPGEEVLGRILLLKGEAGCGKTHLMRVFRNGVHSRGEGYVGYLQMTSVVQNYARYMLGNLIDSLDKPYDAERGPMSGLRRLSNAIAEEPAVIPPDRLERLREADLTGLELAREVTWLADRIVLQSGLGDLDLELIRALFYLQRDDPRIKGRVLRYLRCQDLSMLDRALLGGIVPRKREEDAAALIEQIGTLIARVENGALVLCIDQLEDMYNLDQSDKLFPRAMSAVAEVVSRTPSCIVVISCLEDYYSQLSQKLPRSMVDRIENDPAPVVLTSARSREEIARMIEKRLFCLYEEMEADFDEADPTFPFTAKEIEQHENLRTRDVLDWCREVRDRCVEAGGLIEGAQPMEVSSPPTGPTPSTDAVALAQAWNDLNTSGDFDVPVEEAELAHLFGWAIESCNEELETGHRFSVKPSGAWLDVEIMAGSEAVEELCVGVCNKSARGGGLGRQVVELEQRAGSKRPVILRTTNFPPSPKAKVTLQIGELIARGGRRVLVEDSDWRVMLAMRQFQGERGLEPGFQQWRRSEKPLISVPSLSAAFALNSLKPVVVTTPTLPAVAASRGEGRDAGSQAAKGPATVIDLPVPGPTSDIVLGHATDLRREAVTIATSDLTRHAVFLGGSGSGKTTLALNLIENLLVRGVPALLVDRKGDLCSYAQSAAWDRPLTDPEDEARRRRLREAIEVAVYTPGNPAGRPLTIPIVPDDLGQMAPHEREQQAKFAAAALGEMLNFSPRSRRDAAAIAILGTAIDVFSQFRPDQPLTLDDLLQFIQKKDAALISAVGCLDEKLFGKLAEDLQTLKLTNGQLFSREAERLDVGELLGLDRGPNDKTRLSIISTKFLGDSSNVLFWIAQLLGDVYHTVSKRPSETLQAILMLDEADMYLPAQRKPATKEPMENLLKRARSAGLGIFLATQSPGDLDYKCRDNIRSWFVGRVREQTAINKMRPMLMESPIDISDRLPGQGPGEFHLLSEKRVLGFQGLRNLVAAEQIAEDEILELARSGGVRTLV